MPSLAESEHNSDPPVVTSEERIQALTSLLQGKGHPIPAWLEDLLVAGPRLELWPPVTYRPNRVIITEFLARWLKYAGLSAEECLQWLEPYCLEVLAQYSKSGPSAIRHGTKANTRWVYKSPYEFDFVAMAQEPLPGFEGSPPYMSMFKKWEEEQLQEKIRKPYVGPVFVPVLPVKKRFREQFERAVALAQQKQSEGMGLDEIVVLLNGEGLLSSTGRKWTRGILQKALRDA
jgi:hypothetical protein